MASSGPLDTVTAGQLTTTGNAWDSTPIQSADGVIALCTITFLDPQGAQSDYIFGRNFGFSIPADATILGIVAECKRYCTVDVGGIQDYSIKCTKDGGGFPVVVGTSQSVGALWSSVSTYDTIGNSTNLWGTTWTPAEINDQYFGVAFEMESPNYDSGGETGYIDHLRVTVYYELPTDSPLRIIAMMN